MARLRAWLVVALSVGLTAALLAQITVNGVNALGVATATTINRVTLTAPATGATLTLTDGKTLTVSNSLTLAGTDATVMTFPTTTATLARTDAANTFTGVQTMTSAALTTPTITNAITAGSGMAVANVGANSCGTSAATIAGNNNAGEVTVGTVGGTQCRIAFTSTAPTKWQCTASDETTAVLVRGVPVDTTHADLLGVFTAADVVTYHCDAR